MEFNNDSKIASNVLIIVGLFLAVPLGYAIDIYLFYLIISGKEDTSVWEKRNFFGLFLLMTLPGLGHYVGYRYCRENLGWFQKK